MLPARPPGGWANIYALISRQYKCGYCDHHVASAMGFSATSAQNSGIRASIYICPNCSRPTYYFDGNQVPDVPPGNEVGNLPEGIKSIYMEARLAAGAGAPTASVLACRKLLMNVAVKEGAPEGKNFMSYVEYLAENGYVPPNGKGWVDHIRKKGNEATHEIALMKSTDAEELILFAEMLLKFIYEFPARVPQAPSKTPAP